jgi:hypothetical protein
MCCPERPLPATPFNGEGIMAKLEIVRLTSAIEHISIARKKCLLNMISSFSVKDRTGRNICKQTGAREDPIFS